jgi:hypothetical protein
VGPTSAESGVCTVDFDGSSCAGVSYSDTDISPIVTGFLSGIYAQPVGSTGYYLTAGPSAGSPNTITGTGNCFGFLAGSLDTYNAISFGLVGGGSLSFTGSQIAALASITPNGHQQQSTYWNLLLDPGQSYNQIQLVSTSNAFETDNHAFGLGRDVPGLAFWVSPTHAAVRAGRGLRPIREPGRRPASGIFTVPTNTGRKKRVTH